MSAHLSLTKPIRVELLLDAGHPAERCGVEFPGPVVWLEPGRYAVEPDGLPDGRGVALVPDHGRWQRAAYPAPDLP